MMGWDESFLQSAVDTCTNLSGEIQDCPLFDIQDDSVGAQCQIELPEVLASENDTSSNGLPVNVPIQSGPAYATDYPVYGASAATSYKPSTASASSAVVPTLTYSSAASNSILAQVAAASTPYTESSVTASSAAAASVAASSVVASSVAATITSAASITDATAPGSMVATSYMTNGNEVVEMVIEQVEITVTAYSTAGVRRHLDSHRRRHGVRAE